MIAIMRNRFMFFLACIPLLSCSQASAQRKKSRVRIAEACYAAGGESRDSLDGSKFISEDYEHWVLWKLPDGQLVVEASLIPVEDQVGEFRTEYRFDGNFRFEGFRASVRVEGREAFLNCDFGSSKLACSAKGKVRGEKLDLTVSAPVQEPYTFSSMAALALMTFMGPWNWQQALGHASREPGKKTIIQTYDFAEGKDSFKKGFSKDETITVTYEGQEVLEVLGTGISAHRFNLDGRLIWTAANGLVVKTQEQEFESFYRLSKFIQFESFISGFPISGPSAHLTCSREAVEP